MEFFPELLQDLADDLSLPGVPRAQTCEEVGAGVRLSKHNLQSIPRDIVEAVGVDLSESHLEVVVAGRVRLDNKVRARSGVQHVFMHIT